MIRFLVASALLALVFSTPASASIHLSFERDDVLSKPIRGSNEFRSELASALGVAASKTMIVRSDAQFSANGVVEFYVHASESAFTNRFEILKNLIGGGNFTESTDIKSWRNATAPFATIAVAAGDLLSGLVQFATNGKNVPPNAQPGDAEFGIFLPKTAQSADAYTQLYFGYDDNGAGPDRDYDDLIVSAVFRPTSQQGASLPEPASIIAWSLLGGAAMLGYFRKRRERFSPR